MRDYDVVVIGGGINGLTAAAYLAKAGVSVGVFEARGQCGAHCDTVELGIPGFLHNTHAVWLVPAMSPAMADLELERFGLDLHGTDVLYAKTFADGRNVVSALDDSLTDASLARVSSHDAAVRRAISSYTMEHAEQAMRFGRAIYAAPTPDLLSETAAFYDPLLASLGSDLRGDDLLRVSGMELLESLFESEEVKTMLASLGEYTGQWPVQRRTAAQVLGQAGLAPLAVHTARGGSHALTHSLVRCVVAHGGDVWTTSPVDRILVEDGRACGIRLSPDALWPAEEIRARVVISNLTLAPTFLRLVGSEVIGPSWTGLIQRFSYDDPQLMAVLYALRGDPEFSSAAWDPAIQRAWVGYFGGETVAEMRSSLASVASGIVPDEVMGGWFLPTRADPTQAPEGFHTCYTWVTVPPNPQRWRGTPVGGWEGWRSLAEPLADAVTERWEDYAPGFGDLVLERHVMTPYDQQLNNPSAIRGNMIGGSAIPEQYAENRPLPGIITDGVSRSFVPGLYLSNSIHPFGATHLASGCLVAGEVAEDLDCREGTWWRAQAFDWFFENFGRIPLNRGVSPKWQTSGTGGGPA